MNCFTARLASLILGLAIIAAPSISFAKAKETAKPAIVPYSAFKSWPKEKQKLYIKNLRRFAQAFEKAQVDLKFASNDGFFQQWPSFLPEAIAAEYKYCVVGNVWRNLLPNGKCPLDKRGCAPHGDAGFTCGRMNNRACVTIQPKDTLSDRCWAAGGDYFPSKSEYQSMAADWQELIKNCQDGSINVAPEAFGKNCDRFIAQADKLYSCYYQNTGCPTPGQAPANNGGGTVAVPEKGGTDAIPEKGGTYIETYEPGKGGTIDPAPEKGGTFDPDPVDPVAPPVQKEEEPPKPQGCEVPDYKILGDLACIAQGMEDVNTQDIRCGKGVSRWVALVGAMARTYHDDYTAGDKTRLKIRVAEMIGAYGYCTNDEFPIGLSDDYGVPTKARDWIDNGVFDGGNKKEFSYAYSFLTGGSTVPMMSAYHLFNVQSWSANTPAYHQLRFRGMIQGHRKKHPNSGFAQCGQGIERRMKNFDTVNYCGVQGDKFFRSGDRGRRMESDEYSRNELIFTKMMKRCNINYKRGWQNYKCHVKCHHNDYFGADAYLPNCTNKPEPPCTNNCNPDPPCQGAGCNPTPPGEPETPRDPPVTPTPPQEPETPRTPDPTPSAPEESESIR